MYEKYETPKYNRAIVYTEDKEEPIGTLWCSYIVYPSCIRDQFNDQSILKLLFPI